MSVSCECCVLSGRSLCDELIPHPEGFYRVWCVVVRSKNVMNEATTSVGVQRKKKFVVVQKCLISHTFSTVLLAIITLL